MKISYLRQVRFQPQRLEALASDAYTRQAIATLNQHRHYFSDAVCLRVLRKSLLTDYLLRAAAKSVREDLFRYGVQLLQKKDCGSIPGGAHKDYFGAPDLLVIFLYVFYTNDLRHLDLPIMVRQMDRVTVLDLLNNVGTTGGHDLEVAKIRLFNQSHISVEESYILKRVLRGFSNVKSLTLWKACDNAMLQILGVTCRQLEFIDIWKSTGVNDTGIIMFLGLEAEKPFRVCSTLKKMMIKDTSVTDRGAFHILFWCMKLESLDFSSDTFLHQFLCRVGDSYLKFDQLFGLRSAYLPVSEPLLFHSAIKALPELSDLTVWTSLRQLPDLDTKDFSRVEVLRLGGLSQYSFLKDMLHCVGPQLISLKLETIYFDLVIDEIALACPNLEELTIINARAALSRNVSRVKTLDKLKMVYLFLVQYTDTQYTALHYLLKHATSLESIQVTGTPYLTDSCVESILSMNPLSRLKRFVMSHPVGQDQPLMVPLTARSVTKLYKSCSDLQCIGDLKYWALTPVQRRKLSRELGCTLSFAK